MLSPGVCDRKDVRSGPPGSRRYKMGHDKSCPISRIGMAALFVDTVFGFEALQRSGTKPAKRLDHLSDLDRVPDGVTERLVHVGEDADDAAIGSSTEREHLVGDL